MLRFMNVFAIIIVLVAGCVFSVHGAKDDCENIDGEGAKPIKGLAKKAMPFKTITTKSSKKTNAKALPTSPSLAEARQNRTLVDSTRKIRKMSGLAGAARLIPTTPPSVRVSAPETKSSSAAFTFRAASAHIPSAHSSMSSPVTTTSNLRDTSACQMRRTRPNVDTAAAAISSLTSMARKSTHPRNSKAPMAERMLTR